MKSGYRVFWTDHALEELRNTVEYLELNFSEREIKNLSERIENTLRLISANPSIFPQVDGYVGIHRVVIAKFNTMYYRMSNDQIEVISFFSNRQSPEKRDL